MGTAIKGARNQKGLYAAFASKDTRFDGHFFVGVSSTGIYCRPVCKAKMPKEENCTFYESAAEAEQAGYRPCLICRPELAPGRAVVDATASLARRAARLLEEDCRSGQSLEKLAGRLGCTSRHLRRVFTSEYHIAPVQYVQTCRLLLAKNLLVDTRLSVADIARAAGFGSTRRLNDLFKEHYKLSPLALRKQRAGENEVSDKVTVQLGYRPPYPWQQMLGFLEPRTIAGVEAVHGNRYHRTVRHKTARQEEVLGWLSVGHNPAQNTLTVTISEALLPVLSQVLARIKQMFDLRCEPYAVHEALASMDAVRPGVNVLGTRLPGCYNPFEMAVRAVLGQQITVKAAHTLAGRVVAAYGTPLDTGVEGLTHVFPTPEELLALGTPETPLEERLGVLGVTSARTRTIQALAQALLSENITLAPGANPEEEIQRLMAIKGIGGWTAHYLAMRALEWPDAFLETDVGVKKALAPATPKEILAMAEAWRPWRSYATINLWNSL